MVCDREHTGYTPAMLTFELVVPCYNEAQSLNELFARSVNVARFYGLGPESFQLVIVDNGSTDDTATVLADLASSEDGGYLKTVYLETNEGYGGGLWQGLQQTEAAIVGWTHADGQHDPEDAFRAWEIARKHGRPLFVKGKRLGRATGEWLFSRAFEAAATVLTRRQISEINAQPKVFHRSLLEKLQNPPSDYTFDLYVTLKARDLGWQFESVDVYPIAREHGESHWAGSLGSRVRTSAGFLRFLWNYQGT